MQHLLICSVKPLGETKEFGWCGMFNPTWGNSRHDNNLLEQLTIVITFYMSG